VDLNAIATALAARYDPAVLSPPAGEDPITVATALVPDGIPNTPYVLVTAALDADATFDRGASTRIGVVPMTVTFFLDTAADLKRQMTRLQKWAGVLLDAPLAHTQLGLGGIVATTWTSAFRIGDLEYGGQAYAGVQLTVLVTLSEPISPVA
jgi:hypothetical protein